MKGHTQRGGAGRASRWLALLVLGGVVGTTAGCAAAGPSAATGPSATTAGTFPPGPVATASTPTIPIPDLANLDLDAARADHVTIGPEGGELEVTDANGIAYWLQVPEGALAAPTAMAAIPISRLAGQPEGTTLLAGIHFVPEGLGFWKSADLTITLPAAPSAGVVPVAYGGDFSEPHRYPATVEGATATFGIAHFSGYALLSSTEQAISAAQLGLLLPWDPPSGPADRALSEIAAAMDGTGAAREAAVNQALRRWITPGLETLVSQFRAITTWDHDGPFAGRQHEVAQSLRTWAYLEKLFALEGILAGIPEVDRLRSLGTSAAIHGISVTNSDCNATPTGVLLVLRLPLLRFWQGIANELQIADRDPSFSPEFLDDHACVQVQFNPEGGTDFPVAIEPGQTGTLTIDVGIRVDGTNLRFGIGPLDVAIGSETTDPEMLESTTTDGFGHLTRTLVWNQASPELRIDMVACLPALPDICQQAFVVRGTSPDPTPAGGCPSFRAGSVEGRTWRSVSTSNDSGGAGIGGDMVVSMSMTGGAHQVSGTGTWFVDAGSTPAGSHDVTIVWEGEIFWQGGAPGAGGTASVTMGANAPSVTRSIPAPGAMTPSAIRIEQSLVVAHGDVIEITFSASASSSDDEIGLSFSGSLDFLTPAGVSIVQTECDD